MRQFSLLLMLFCVTAVAQSQPVISSFTPLSAKPGDSVVITGTGFNSTIAGNIVFFGATRATVTLATTTSLRATVPTGATLAPVTVLNTATSLSAASRLNFSPIYPNPKTSITSADFESAVNYTTGSDPDNAAVGDIDGDGKPDLIIANRTSNTLSVLRNTATSGFFNGSSFATKVDFTTGTGPQSIALGDLDGDGKLDVVVSNATSNTLSIFRNTSTSGTITSGSFASRIDLSTGTGSAPYDPIVADFNGDGKPDLATTCYASGAVAVFQNIFVSGTLSSTSFATRQDFSLGMISDPTAMACGDLDGDGKVELIIALYQSSQITVFQNTSSGGSIGFSSIGYWVGFNSASVSIAVADIDGDSKLDIITGVLGTSSNYLSILRNTTTVGVFNGFSFATSVNFTTSPTLSPSNISVGDLNGDGKPDIGYLASVLNIASVLLNTGSPGLVSLASPVDIPGSNRIIKAIADLDGDNRPDLIGTTAGQVSICRNRSNNSFLAGLTLSSGALAPAFSSTTNTYATTVPNLTTTVTVSPSVADPSSSTSINGVTTASSSVPLTVGVNTITIIVTAQNLATRTYTIAITRLPSSNADLSSLTISSGTLSPVFASATTSYAATAGHTTTSVTVTPTRAEPNATIQLRINGGSFAVTSSGTASTALPITTGSNTIDVRVIAQDSTVKTYSVVVTKLTAPPAIASFSPTSAIQGNTVTITGTGFDPTASNNLVFFGGVRATVLTASATNITVTIPAGASYAPIRLLNASTRQETKSLLFFKPIYTPAKPGVVASGFSTSRDFASGAGPVFVAAADLDGDGKLDLVSANNSGGSISVFRNTSVSGSMTASSFAAKQDFAAGTGPISLAVGDLDGDGKLDIVVANAGASTISVLRNTSTTGTINSSSFAAKVDYTTGSSPYAIAIDDLDSDGKPDLAVVNQGANSVSLLRNVSTPGSFNGNSFDPKIDITISGGAHITTGDIDRDGKPDLIVVNSGLVSLLRNTATSGILTTSSFAPKVDFGTGSSPSFATVGDVDGDDRLDLVVVNTNSSTISVIRNTAVSGSITSGSFATRVDFPTLLSPVSAAMSDLNSDGKIDIAVSNQYASSVSMYRNLSTTGSITTASLTREDLTTLVAPRSVAVADMDGDGRPDIVIASDNSGAVSVHRSLSNITALSALSVSSGTLTPAFNGVDTNYTMFLTNATSSITVTPTKVDSNATIRVNGVLVNSGSSSSPLALSVGSNTITILVTAEDGSTKTYSLVITRAPAISTITSVTPSKGLVGTSVLISGTNFNTTPANNTVFFGATKANVTAVTATSITVSVPTGATNAPVSVLNTATGITAYSPLPFTPTYSPAKATLAASDFPLKQDFATAFGPNEIAMGDLDGDGKLDLAIVNYGAGSVSVYRNTSTNGSIGAGSFAARVDFTTGTNPIGVAIGDLNGDGKPELAVTNLSSGTVSVFRNTATSGSLTTSSFAAKVDFATDASPWFVGIADIDMEGKPELIVTNRGANSVSVFRNTSTIGTLTASSFAPRVNFTTGNAPRLAAIGDLNGDGKPELAVANQNSSLISIFRNNSSPFVIDSNTFGAKVDFTVGANPYSIAIGDADGDTKPDLAVSNTASTSISILRNTITAGTINSGSFATKVDFASALTPAYVYFCDLDGNGKLDLCVANQDAANISIFRNTAVAGIINATSFDAKIDFATGASPSCIVAGDIDGDGKPDLVVSNYNGTTFSVLRNADLSNNSNLSALSISSGSLTPSFASTITSYSASVVNATTSITLTATKADANASITLNGTSITSASAFGPIALVEGNNALSVVVMAQDSTTKTYTVNVFRAPSIPTISSFIPASGAAGTTVTLTGNGFSNITTNNIVFFGATAATVTAASNTSLSVTIPIGATYNPITVINTATGLSANSLIPFSPIYAPLKPTIHPADFSTNQNFATGPDPWSAASGDMDGDGKPELIIANRLSNSVSVLKNTSTAGNIGSGSFATKQDFATGTNPNAVCIADVDRDGKLDLIVANTATTSNSVSVLRNTSSGGVISFAAKQDFAVGAGPIAAAAADLDGDGKPEIVVANSGSTTISILRNTALQGSISSSSFAAKQDFTVGSAPYAVTIGDVDGDGKPDLAAANLTSNTVSVLRNTAVSGVIDSNSFAAKQDFVAGTSPLSIAICDLDGDGKSDLAVLNNGGVGSVSVLRNTGTTGSINAGSFAAKQDFSVGITSPYDMCIGNLDGNNKPDIAVANLGGNSVSVLRNTATSGSIGAGSFAAKVDFAIGGGAKAITIVDVDGDGRPDLAAANRSNSCVSVMRNTDLPPAITSFTPASGIVGSSVTITGTNFSTTPAGNVVYFGATRATVATATTTSLTVTVPAGATYAPLSVLVAGSGLTCSSSSVFTPTYSPSKTGLALSDFTTKQTFTTGTGPYSVAAGDIDGDGKPDLAVANFLAGTVSVYRNTSTSGSLSAGSFASRLDIATGTNPTSVAIGDVNGDGKLDLAVTNSGSNTISILRNTATSGSISASSFASKVDFTTGTAPGFVLINDIDADGKPELIVTNSSSASVSIFRNINVGGTIVSTSFATKVDFATNTNPRIAAVADLDGDGKPDLAVACQIATSLVSVFRNTSTTGTIDVNSFAAKVDFTAGANPYGIAIGDADGDGKPDLAVANSNTNTVSVLRNTAFAGSINTGSFATKVDFTIGITPRFVSFSDLDGNGKPELISANLTNDNISVLRNTATLGSISAASFAAKVDLASGVSTNAVIAADLDGDGKTDLAAVNYNDSSLSIFRNTDLSNNADLTTLTLSIGSISPTFTSSTTAYTTTVVNSTLSLSVTAALAQVNATMRVRINGGSYAALSTGTPSGPLSLNPGMNTIDVSVTAENGLTVKTYTISVVRLAPIANNSITASQVICSGTSPAVLSGSTPTGGNATTYTYQWLSSTVSATAGFGPASGTGATQNYTPASLTQNTWYRRLVVSDVFSDTSAAIAITVNAAGTWTGLIGSDWGNAANWSCPQIPSATTNVIIPSGVTNMPILSGIQQCRNLTINAGATLTLSGAATQLSLFGTVANNGSLLHTAGAIAFIGNVQQNIPAGNYAKVIVSNPAGVVLDGPTVLNDSLILANGLLTLGNHTLTLNNTSMSSAGSNASYIRTNSNGAVQVNNVGPTGKSGAIVVPVGNTAFNPVTLTNSGTNDNFTIRVIDSVTLSYSGLTPIGSRVTTNAVNRTWAIAESTAGGSNLTLTLQWNASDELSAFTRSAAYVARYNGSLWNNIAASAASGSNPYTLSRSGITALSVFGVGSAGMLPVALVSFTATASHNAAVLEWETASELNNDYFEIERSFDGHTFDLLSPRIKGQGTTATSHRYSYIDDDAAHVAETNQGVVYYRLKQVDVDGKYNYSSVRAVSMKRSRETILAQPNPYTDYSSIIITATQSERATLLITDVKGHVLSSQIVTIEEGTNQIKLQQSVLLESGMYLVTVITSQYTSTLKLLKN